MKLFSEKVDSTFTNSSFNVLQVESFTEIFFDVYEIELNKIKYPAEKIGDYNGHPVVSVPVVIGEQECDYPFVLIKGPFEILFNENNKVAGTPSRRVNTVDTTEPELIELFEQTSEEDEVTFDNLIEEESRVKIADQIKTAKRKAADHIAKLKQAAIEDATIDLKLKKEEFDKVLQIAKDQLVSEFVYVSNTIKKELLDDNDSRYFELESIVGEKINEIASSLRDVVVEDFNSATEAFDISIKTLISNIHDTQVLPRVESVLNNISTTVDDKVTKLSELVEHKLAGKADIALLEDINNSVNAVQVANVELNNALVKGVNKALSRVGTVNTKINEAVVALSDNVETKIRNATDSIVSYYTEKIQKLEDRTFEINESSRQYFINLVQESRDNLIKEIRDIKQETPVEYIVESKNGRATKSLDSITSELDKKITGKVSEEIARLKQYISMYSSGGGSVAKQFAAGGTMNGDLTVVGAISANQYLGITIPTGDYLPLSGGTITGDLTVRNTLSAYSLSAERIFATQLDALSANITVIDIKQYELSGFNVTGNCTIQGSVSSNNAVYGSNLVYLGGNTAGSNLTIGTNDSYNLAFETNGVNRMTILSSGFVGIGTTTPNERLTVSDSISANATLATFVVNGTNGLAIGRRSDGNGPYVTINSTTIFFGSTISNTATNNAINLNNSGISISTAGSNLPITLSPNGTGSVDIRNGLNPQSFNIYNTYTNATSAERTAFKYINNDFVISTESLPLSAPQRSMLFQTASATRMTILSSGEVGIGQAPAAGISLITNLGIQSSNGNIVGATAGAIGFAGRSRIYSPADNFFQLRNNANTSFASVSAADFESTSSVTGVILRSPDNSRWRLTVTNTGALSTTKL